MAKNIYALLVGINKYAPDTEVPTLYGCVNDTKAIEAYLRKRIATDKKWQLVESNVPWILINEQATRQAIINGFQQHLYLADRVKVHYSTLRVMVHKNSHHKSFGMTNQTI